MRTVSLGFVANAALPALLHKSGLLAFEQRLVAVG